MSKLDTLRDSGIEEIFTAMLACEWDKAYNLIASYKDEGDKNLSIATTCLRQLVRNCQLTRYIPHGYNAELAAIDDDETKGLEGWVDDLFYAVNGVFVDEALSLDDIEALDDDRRSDQILLAWLGMSGGLECTDEDIKNWFESAFEKDDWRRIYCSGIFAQSTKDPHSLRKAIEALGDHPVLQAYLISCGAELIEDGKPFSSLEDLEKSLALLESRLGKQETFTQTARLALISGLQREGGKEEAHEVAIEAAKNEVFWRREIVSCLPLTDSDVEKVIGPIIEKLPQLRPQTESEYKDRASALYALGFFPSTSTEELCAHILAILERLDDAAKEEIVDTMFKYYEGDGRIRELVELTSSLLLHFEEYSDLWHHVFEHQIVVSIPIDTRSALEKAKEYQKLCEGHYGKDSVDYWTTQMLIGMIYKNMGNGSRARRYWKAAADNYERLAPEEMRTEIWSLRIEIGKSLGEEELYEEALEIFTKLAEDEDGMEAESIIDIEEGIGDALCNLDRTREALPHHEKCRKVAEECRYSDCYLQATLDLANDHINLGQDKKGLKYFKEARDFAYEIYGEKSRELGHVLGIQATAMAKGGYLQQALATADEGLLCDLEPASEKILYLAKSMAYGLQGKRKEAARYMALAMGKETEMDTV